MRPLLHLGLSKEKQMRRTAVVLVLALSMMMIGCSSGVSQKDYDDLKTENERLLQHLEKYEGSSVRSEGDSTSSLSVSDGAPRLHQISAILITEAQFK